MMNRRAFLQKSFLAAGASLAVSPLTMCRSRSAARPNLLFLFADDLSHEALSVLGSQAQTPNLDQLVRQGVTFRNAYNQGAWHGAVCVASRTMLMTGRFLGHARLLEPLLDQEVKEGRLWPQVLAQAGYDTYMSGKWHVNADVDKAFQHTIHIRGGMPGDTPEGYHRPVTGQRDPWQADDAKRSGYWKDGTHWSEVVRDDAIAFLNQAKQQSKPFFLYLPFNAPHDPRQSPQAYLKRYPIEQISVPANFMAEYPLDNEIGCGQDLRDERLAPLPRTEYAVKVHRREYYALISHLDDQIGRILNHLEKTGQASRTFIFFSADNGLAIGHHGLFGKQNMFEHSMKVPLIVAGPGIPQGRYIDAPVYLQDIMPTCLELAGITIPEYVQFKSLMPLVKDK